MSALLKKMLDDDYGVELSKDLDAPRAHRHLCQVFRQAGGDGWGSKPEYDTVNGYGPTLEASVKDAAKEIKEVWKR